MRAYAINGYVSQFQVYLGKVGGRSETHIHERVVKDLTRNHVGKHYTVYCDNFFTSVQLFNDLLKDSIYACGTIRSNRVGYPDEFKPFLKKGLPERGDYKTIEKENCIFSLWQDNKTVSVLSTNCRNEEGTVTRKQKDGTRKTFTCPLNVIDYNKYMGGVDCNDRLQHYYCVRLKSHKFYKYIFWFLFELTLANAYILHRYVPSTGHVYHQYVDFKSELAKQLIGNYNGRKVRGRPSSAIHPSVPTLHFPMKAAKRSKCSHCYRKGKQLKWTQWECQMCKKNLCHTGKPDSDCFLAFHNY